MRNWPPFWPKPGVEGDSTNTHRRLELQEIIKVLTPVRRKVKWPEEGLMKKEAPTPPPKFIKRKKEPDLHPSQRRIQGHNSSKKEGKTVGGRT